MRSNEIKKAIMQEVLDKLNKTKFDVLYKNNDRDLEFQEERRWEMLEVQKSNRKNLMDRLRGVLGSVQREEQRNIFQQQPSETYWYRPEIYVAGFNKCPYKDVLMHSEWMVSKPKDFHENWYVVPCPKGVRTLVVASQGKTKLFNRHGSLIRSCQTALPGGSPKTISSNSHCCILDGFLDYETHTVHILDLLALNMQIMTDGETEFRHFWLLHQLEVLPGLKERTSDNNVIFKVIPKMPCDCKNFQDFMMKYPPFENFDPKLDGLLFYHKLAEYVSGVNPLVGWLYPYMVPEVFGLDVKINARYMLEKPDNYTNQADFIVNFAKKKQRKERRRSDRMDTTPVEVVVETLTESGAFDPEESDQQNEARGYDSME